MLASISNQLYIVAVTEVTSIFLSFSGQVLVSIGKENLQFQGSSFSYYGLQALSKFS